MDVKERVFEGKLKGYCCSESVMDMALEDMGWDLERRRPLVKAMGAFCGGVHEGLACGTLCAAKAALWVAVEDGGRAFDVLGPELMGWFRERVGAWDCADLLEGDLARRQTLCPVIVEDTYIKLYDMLEDIGAV
jgi:hypothetical protein